LVHMSLPISVVDIMLRNVGTAWDSAEHSVFLLG